MLKTISINHDVDDYANSSESNIRSAPSGLLKLGQSLRKATKVSEGE